MNSRFFYHPRHSPSSEATTRKNLCLIIPEIFYAYENIYMHLYFLHTHTHKDIYIVHIYIYIKYGYIS